jgi:hypothetical protein
VLLGVKTFRGVVLLQSQRPQTERRGAGYPLPGEPHPGEDLPSTTCGTSRLSWLSTTRVVRSADAVKPGTYRLLARRDTGLLGDPGLLG